MHNTLARITVQDMLDWLAAGQSEQQVLVDYPELSADDIRAVLAHAADRERHAAWVRVAA